MWYCGVEDVVVAFGEEQYFPVEVDLNEAIREPSPTM